MSLRILGEWAMLAVLVALRDALLALALSWVGFTLEHPQRASAPAAVPVGAAPACGGGESPACAPDKPAFNALNCGSD